MLFNSYEFIFLLLPIALIGYRLLGEAQQAKTFWLLACSLFFYGYWNPNYLILLLGSIAFNFVVGRRLASRPTRFLLTTGILFNLAAIAYFKYAGFLVGNLNAITNSNLTLGNIALPLAISFFTFQQIAFLVDCYAGKSKVTNPINYALFVSFFPQLIAGPIVHHSELMPQIQENKRSDGSDLAIGIAIFSIGLFKKAVLADGIAPYSNALFDSPAAWNSPTMIHAWMGTLSYAFQIYFDFSGYSDMAIGAARLFGIKLPLNFFAPYRALNISDFWRRWHMTLSRFLRDYLYIPLGGNRKGTAARYRNLMITMLLGGLWHGAGWTFVFWGLLHGIYLVVQHGWSHLTAGFSNLKSNFIYRFCTCATTFIAVCLAWVYFRAESLDSANRIICGMIGQNGVTVPEGIALRFGETWFSNMGVQLDGASGTQFLFSAGWIITSFAIVWLLPTTQQWLRNFAPALEYAENNNRAAAMSEEGFGWKFAHAWRPSVGWCIATAAVAAAGILSLSEVSEFLYFQF